MKMHATQYVKVLEAKNAAAKSLNGLWAARKAIREEMNWEEAAPHVQQHLIAAAAQITLAIGLLEPHRDELQNVLDNAVITTGEEVHA